MRRTARASRTDRKRRYSRPSDQRSRRMIRRWTVKAAKDEVVTDRVQCRARRPERRCIRRQRSARRAFQRAEREQRAISARLNRGFVRAARHIGRHGCAIRRGRGYHLGSGRCRERCRDKAGDNQDREKSAYELSQHHPTLSQNTSDGGSSGRSHVRHRVNATMWLPASTVKLSHQPALSVPRKRMNGRCPSELKTRMS